MDAEAKETGNDGCQKCGRCFTVKDDHKLVEVEGDTKPSIEGDKLIDKKDEPGDEGNDKPVIVEDRTNVVDNTDSSETS